MSTKSPHGEGSIHRRHDHPTCPPLDGQGKCPKHRCQGRWTASIELNPVNGQRRRAALFGDSHADHLLMVRGTLARTVTGLQIQAPKTERSRRTIPISAATAAVLEAVHESQTADRAACGDSWSDTGLVFTTELGQPIDPRNASRAMSIAARKAGLDGVGIHTLRHTAASTMLEAGVPLRTVSLDPRARLGPGDRGHLRPRLLRRSTRSGRPARRPARLVTRTQPAPAPAPNRPASREASFCSVQRRSEGSFCTSPCLMAT